MKFIFVCPETKQMFESDDFEIVENKGISVDAAGNKTLDAKIQLSEPCPFCKEKHIFHANELVCPFDTNDAKAESCPREP